MEKSGNGHNSAKRRRVPGHAEEVHATAAEGELISMIGLAFLRLVLLSGHMGLSLKSGLRYFDEAKVEGPPTLKKSLDFVKEALTSRPSDVYQKWFLHGKEFERLARDFMNPPDLPK